MMIRNILEIQQVVCPLVDALSRVIKSWHTYVYWSYLHHVLCKENNFHDKGQSNLRKFAFSSGLYSVIDINLGKNKPIRLKFYLWILRKQVIWLGSGNKCSFLNQNGGQTASKIPVRSCSDEELFMFSYVTCETILLKRCEFAKISLAKSRICYRRPRWFVCSR